MWSRYFKKTYGKHIISLRNILYKKHIILYERCTVPCENRVASYKKCTVLCKKSTISYTLYSVWEVCGKCTADKVVCFRVYTESQAVSSQKSSHCKHTVSIIISVTKKYRTGCIVFNPLLHILNFEIFVSLIMHKNICHCKIMHTNHECNGFSLSFLFLYYWLLTLGCCQSQVIFLLPFH